MRPTTRRSAKGKVVVTIEWGFVPANDMEPAEETIQVHAKLDTPKQSTEAAKVVWHNGQMTLL